MSSLAIGALGVLALLVLLFARVPIAVALALTGMAATIPHELYERIRTRRQPSSGTTTCASHSITARTGLRSRDARS